jgi:DNA-binding LytR/AlgR family response regulator
MTKLTCIAIDDEPLALEVIKSFAAKISFLDLKATFVNAFEALTFLKSNEVNVVFLDINMPDLTGLDMASMLGRNTKTIFTTAYAQHAIKGFELSALDYLLKPIELGRFVQACNKAFETLSDSHRSAPSIFVKDGYDWVRVSLDELLYVASEGNYLTFYETNKKTVTRMTIGEAMQQLPKTAFKRVHKSYIVALDKIEKIERHQVIINKIVIPLAGTFRDVFLEGLR